MTLIVDRNNARLGDTVRLTAMFYSGGQSFDPFEFRHVEIYRGGDGPEHGGILVDVVDPSNIIQDSTGVYSILLQLTDLGSPGVSPMMSPNGSPSLIFPSPYSPGQPEPYIPQSIYYDRWIYKETPNSFWVHSVGLNFYIYPSLSVVTDDQTKWRFELKPDRKRIVRNENLDIRLQIIPIPLYRSRRDPIVDYLLPLSTMRIQIWTANRDLMVDWTTIRFTGKEGILPTKLFGPGFMLGEYHIVVDFILPNNQSIRYPRYPIQLVD